MTVAERTKAGLDSFKANKEKIKQARETLGAISSLLRQAINTPAPTLVRADEVPEVATNPTQPIEDNVPAIDELGGAPTQSAPTQVIPANTTQAASTAGSASAQPMVQPTTQTESATAQPTVETPGEVNQQQPSMVIPRADSNYDPSKSKGVAMASFN